MRPVGESPNYKPRTWRWQPNFHIFRLCWVFKNNHTV